MLFQQTLTAISKLYFDWKERRSWSVSDVDPESIQEKKQSQVRVVGIAGRTTYQTLVVTNICDIWNKATTTLYDMA